MGKRFLFLLASALTLSGCLSWGGAAEESRAPVAAVARAAAKPAAPPSWMACSKASCWDGQNALTRHMNVLSSKFDEATVKARFEWAKARGCNCVHLILANKADGEGSGYSLYGGAPAVGRPDKAAAARFLSRIELARSMGLGVVLWLMTDDSADWCHALAANADGYLADLKQAGILAHASTIVLGLELDEWASAKEVAALAAACRKHAPGVKVGVHHTSGKATFASSGDILFWQTDPGKSAVQIASETKRALAKGKPVNFFELSRSPAQELSKAALSAGAFAVGNW